MGPIGEDWILKQTAFVKHAMGIKGVLDLGLDLGAHARQVGAQQGRE